MDRTLDIYTEGRVEAFPWILKRAAIELERAIPGARINPGEPGDGIHYFVNHGKIRDVSGISIGHLTHFEHDIPVPRAQRSRTTFLKTIEQCDWLTVTCELTRQIAIEHGARPERIAGVRYGCDERLSRKIVFGVVGRVYPTGRKGEHLAVALRRMGHTVVAWGKDWPLDVPELFPGSPWDTLPEFYDQIDYLIVTSQNEGGPVPVIDAITAGVPVIAPDVGWCWEFPVIRYEVGSLSSLVEVITRLTTPPKWSAWVRDHQKLFEKACA